MINTNELRIGNWVYKTEFGSDKEEKRLYIIKWPRMDFTFTEAYFPIQLTPEILIKAGFKKYGDWLIFNRLSVPTSININLASEKLTIGSNEEYRIDAFDFHLHSLQNLYFALTGEELDIKM